MKIGAFEVSHGDRVAFVDARGQERTGKANGLLLFPTHCVVDMGGQHGTPYVVQADRILSVLARRNRGQMDLLAASGVA
jgi:hypothetical protein